VNATIVFLCILFRSLTWTQAAMLKGDAGCDIFTVMYCAVDENAADFPAT
jgi:hypothetical protein